MSNNITIFQDSHVGLILTTNIHVKNISEDIFEARVGFACFGNPNMTPKQFDNCNYDPFHNEFYDNFATGNGKTKDDAIKDLSKELDSIYESMWR